MTSRKVKDAQVSPCNLMVTFFANLNMMMQRPVWKEQWCARQDAVESSGGKQDQFWATGESGTLAPTSIPTYHAPASRSVDHVTSYLDNSNFSLTIPHSSTSNTHQPRVGLEHATAVVQSSSRKSLATKLHSREPSTQRISTSHTTHHSSREASRASRAAAPYPPLSATTETRRAHKEETSAFQGEWAQFKSHSDSSSLRDHGMHPSQGYVRSAGHSVSPATPVYSPPGSASVPPSSQYTSSRPHHHTQSSATYQRTPTFEAHNSSLDTQSGMQAGSWHYDMRTWPSSQATQQLGQYVPSSHPANPASISFQPPFSDVTSTNVSQFGYNQYQTYAGQFATQSYGEVSVPPNPYHESHNDIQRPFTSSHYPHTGHSRRHGNIPDIGHNVISYF